MFSIYLDLGVQGGRVLRSLSSTFTYPGVRPYKCEQCDKSFTQRCSLESHMRKVHGVLHNYGYKERRNKVLFLNPFSNVGKKTAGSRPIYM